MKRIVEILGFSRSHLSQRMKETPKARSNYQMTRDAEMLALICTLVRQRLTKGYCRIGALLNRIHKSSGLPAFNDKKVDRLMKQNNLLLTRHTGKPKPERVQESNEIT